MSSSPSARESSEPLSGSMPTEPPEPMPLPPEPSVMMIMRVMARRVKERREHDVNTQLAVSSIQKWSVRSETE